jgi:D-ribose pyranase
VKKGGILHPELSRLVASLGHTDYVLLADKGFPVPSGVERINLGLADDLPTVLQVLEALATEMIIDRIVITHEMNDISPKRVQALRTAYPQVCFEAVSHVEFKEWSRGASGAVKTADTCPYANILVVSG